MWLGAAGRGWFTPALIWRPSLWRLMRAESATTVDKPPSACYVSASGGLLELQAAEQRALVQPNPLAATQTTHPVSAPLCSLAPRWPLSL